MRFIGYRPGDRTARAQFAWDNLGGWLWRHKVAAFAQRIGIKTLEGLQRVFGPRWAYFLQGEILGEELGAIVYPSFRAAMVSRGLSDAQLIAQWRAERIVEEMRISKGWLPKAP